MVRQRRKVRFSKHKQRAWGMDASPNGAIRIVSFAHYSGMLYNPAAVAKSFFLTSN